MTLPPDRLEAVVVDQTTTLAEAARRGGDVLRHVKAHGALYNMAAGDPALARAIGRAVQRVDGALIVVALAGSRMAGVLQEMGLRVAQEAFIDRGYTSQGTLVPRDQAGALITDAAAAADRAVRLARESTVRTVDGAVLRVDADTLCIHGDSPGAAELAQRVRGALEQAGVVVHRMDGFL